jgi:A/G-specific adenine glycosylase
MGRKSIEGRLLGWYRRNRRDLPWRRTRDPYAIWVSEIMLQQTRVAAALPYYERFLRRFPDVASLARARLDSVLALWSGLGYYRRARSLHAAAKVVCREGIPDSAEGLRALPGIGAYTANAIASIAYGEAVAVIDGNVERVLSRLHAIAEPKSRRLRPLADAWLPADEPGDFNQAVMELGALVCTPRSPACTRCPLHRDCLGRAAPESYPRPRARPRIVVEEHAVGFVVRDGRVLLRKRGPDGLLAGMWELPPSRARGAPIATVNHGVLHKRLVYRVHAGRARKGRFFTPAQARRLALTTAARKCLAAAGFLASEPRQSRAALNNPTS